MKIQQFRDETELCLRKFHTFSNLALEALTMIAAHESLGCTIWRQIGGGPGRGPFQIERETHDSIWLNSDSIAKRARALGITQNWLLLESNFEYNVFIARQYLLMDKNPLPRHFIQRAEYCKTYWNRTGKASPEAYIRDLILWERGDIG